MGRKEACFWIAILLFATILILDQLWMFGIDFFTNRFLGDWSQFHIEPFHHAHLGLLLLILIVLRIYLLRWNNLKRNQRIS